MPLGREKGQQCLANETAGPGDYQSHGGKKTLTIVSLAINSLTVASASNAPQRFRAVTLNVVAAVAGKGFVAASQLVLMTLMLMHLGTARYGIWVTFQSVLMLPALFDLGISNASVNDVAEATARGDVDRISRVIGSSLLLLVGCAVFAALCFACGMLWLSSRAFFELPDVSTQADLAAGTIVFAIALLVMIPLGLIESVVAALQQSWIANLPRAGAALVALACGWVTLSSGASFALVCVATTAPAAIGLLAAWGLAWWLHPAVRLQGLRFDRSMARSLVDAGLQFYGIQVCGVLGFGIDTILIYALAGPDAAAAYAAPQRIFAMVVIAVTLVLGPLWPAYAHAIADGDVAWVRRALCLSLGFAVFLGIVGATTVAACMPWITHHWLGNAITVSPLMTFGFVLMMVSQCVGVAIAMYWNASRQLRLQFRLSGLFVTLATPLKLLAIERLGIEWLPLLSAGSYLLAILVPGIALLAFAGQQAAQRDATRQAGLDAR